MQDTVYTIDEIIRRVSPVAEKYGLPAVYLFGSYARGEATPESDVDLLVDISGTDIRGFQYGGLYADLEEALGKSLVMVDVSTLDYPTDRRSQLRFREAVRRERVKIYGAA